MTLGDICKFCHCSREESGLSLISPCLCAGSVKFVDAVCLQRWMGSFNKKTCELCRQIITIDDYKWKPFSQWTKPNFSYIECKDLIIESVISLVCITNAAMCTFLTCRRMSNTELGLNEFFMLLPGICVVSMAISLLVSSTSFFMRTKIIILVVIIITALLLKVFVWKLTKMDRGIDVTLTISGAMFSVAFMFVGSRSMYLMQTEITILIEKWKVNNRMPVVREVNHI